MKPKLGILPAVFAIAACCLLADKAQADSSLCISYAAANCTTLATSSNPNNTYSSFTANVAGTTVAAAGFTLVSTNNVNLTIGTQGTSTLGSEFGTNHVASISNTNVYTKYTPGTPAETGIGLTNDPSGQDEIYYTAATSLAGATAGIVALNVSNLRAAGAKDVLLQIGSVQTGESFQIFGSTSNLSTTNSSAANLTLLYSGDSTTLTDTASQIIDLNAVGRQSGTGGAINDFSATSFTQYYVVATNANVVLDAVAVVTATPEPSTFAMLFGAAGLAGIIRRKAVRK